LQRLAKRPFRNRPVTFRSSRPRRGLRPSPRGKPRRTQIRSDRSRKGDWRRRPDSNRWIRVLQTLALPLGYVAETGRGRSPRPQVLAESGRRPRSRRDNLERETGFEPATPTLARLCSTTELFPPNKLAKNSHRAGDCQGRPAARPFRLTPARLLRVRSFVAASRLRGASRKGRAARGAIGGGARVPGCRGRRCGSGCSASRRRQGRRGRGRGRRSGRGGRASRGPRGRGRRRGRAAAAW
jgi:hypothetical protein